MPSRRPSASGGPDAAAPSPAALFAALPASFQAAAVDFTVEPFARLTYAYPSRPPARLDLDGLPVPMRQEVAYWLHTLAVAGERVNSWALAGWVRVAAAMAAGGVNFARISPAWLREAIQWYFAAGLSTGLLSWSSLPGFLSYLGRHFAAFLAAEGIDSPALDADPDAGIRPVALRLAAWLRQQRTRSGRPLAPSTIGLIQTTVAGFYAFMADRRAEAARELAEPRWAGLSDAHARWWRPGEIAGSGSYRGQAEGNYIDAAALSRIAGHVEILGLPRDQARTVTVNGTPRQIRGLGDEQAMRAFLLAIATGRRINEILMMDFAPLSPVPGLDTSQATQDGGPAARLRYQQTKIAGAPQAILVGADVVAIVTEQQHFARALVRASDPAASDPPYLFLARQANTAGQRHYRANTLNGLLTQLAAALQITDATGAVVDFQRTHRMRHTKATDLLNAGVPLHVVQRYMGHLSPEMTMHYARTLAETHERNSCGSPSSAATPGHWRWTPPTSTSWCSWTATPTGSCPTVSACCRRRSAATAGTPA